MVNSGTKPALHKSRATIHKKIADLSRRPASDITRTTAYFRHLRFVKNDALEVLRPVLIISFLGSDDRSRARNDRSDVLQSRSRLAFTYMGRTRDVHGTPKANVAPRTLYSKRIRMVGGQRGMTVECVIEFLHCYGRTSLRRGDMRPHGQEKSHCGIPAH